MLPTLMNLNIIRLLSIRKYQTNRLFLPHCVIYVKFFYKGIDALKIEYDSDMLNFTSGKDNSDFNLSSTPERNLT